MTITTKTMTSVSFDLRGVVDASMDVQQALLFNKASTGHWNDFGWLLQRSYTEDPAELVLLFSWPLTAKAATKTTATTTTNALTM
jgi:hypothetical protein